MFSVINNISPNTSIYSSGAHNESIDQLLSAATNKKCLNENLGNTTVKDHLDALFNLSKTNNQDSIELLQNLALADGEISSYAQNLICKLIARHDGATYQSACSARSGCQMLVAGISREFVSDEMLHNNPKILLAAASNIDGDAPHLDPIPQTVKSKVNQFNDMKERPQWWLDSKPHDGVFNKVDLSSVEKKDYLVIKYSIPNDGACQFRAALALSDKDEKWLHATKNEIRSELEKKKACICAIIKDTVDTLDSAGIIPDRFKDFFSENGFEEKIYNKTIGTSDFTLYTPIGVASSIGEFQSLTTDEHEFLSTLCDGIGEKINYEFDIHLSSDSSTAYAEHTGNHYNIIVPREFFNSKS